MAGITLSVDGAGNAVLCVKMANEREKGDEGDLAHRRQELT